MLLFLSYAIEDGEIACEIADRLSSKDVSVYPSHGSTSRLGLTAADPEAAIHQADAFLALLSPDSLTSTSCRRERELALHRQERDSSAGFVQVLQVRQTPYHRAGLLHSRPWLDLTGEVAREHVLSGLAARFEPDRRPRPSEQSSRGGTGLQRPRQNPHFRNRERELEEIQAGLGNQDGEHFWLMIAPPQMGKTWLLDRIGATYERNPSWVVRFVDVRELAAEVAADPEQILRMMFGGRQHPSADQSVAESIATDISRSGRYHLCLLDSAELLSDGTVRALRQSLSQISKGIAESRSPNARLALVAASRRDNEWKGISPAPRMQIRRLTQFKAEVIQDALQELAQGRAFSSAELRDLALRLHSLSEGLPALLASCLGWIRDRDFQGLDRLEDYETFDRIARSYIDADLFSPGSMRGGGYLPTAEQQATIQQALRILSPYRFLTVSHLSHHATDGDLLAALERLDWSVQDLWAAVSTTDLLYRPIREPWQEIYAPIRRLLFRHAYRSVADRSRTHREACEFMQSFLAGQSGSDQCRAFVECLWHKAQELILVGSPDVEGMLLAFARELDTRLTPYPMPGSGFDLAALRDVAAWCMTNDHEFAETVGGFTDLFERLVNAVRQPT